MHLAAYYGHMEMLQELLERFNCEADKRDKVNSVTIYKHTFLLSTDCTSNVSSSWYTPCLLYCYIQQRRWTPLFAAACQGHMKIVQYLVEEKGCDPAAVTAVSNSYKCYVAKSRM